MEDTHNSIPNNAFNNLLISENEDMESSEWRKSIIGRFSELLGRNPAIAYVSFCIIMVAFLGLVWRAI